MKRFEWENRTFCLWEFLDCSPSDSTLTPSPIIHIFMRKSPSKGPLRHVFRPIRAMVSPARADTGTGKRAAGLAGGRAAQGPDGKARCGLRSASPLGVPAAQHSSSNSCSDFPRLQGQSTSTSRDLASPPLKPQAVPRLREMYREIIREHQRLKAKIANQQVWIQKLVSERLSAPSLEPNFSQRRGLSSALDCYQFSGLSDSKEEHSDLSHYTVPPTSTPSPKPQRDRPLPGRGQHRRGTSLPRERQFPKEVFPMSFKRRPG